MPLLDLPGGVVMGSRDDLKEALAAEVGGFQAAVSNALDDALASAPEPAAHFALVAGITEKHLSRIRRGHQLGTPEVLDAIANALGLSWRALLVGDGDQPDRPELKAGDQVVVSVAGEVVAVRSDFDEPYISVVTALGRFGVPPAAVSLAGGSGLGDNQ